MLRELYRSVRTLLRRPAFSAVVVVTLALGLGANTALFSVVDAVLLSPLPYPESDRLVQIWETTERGGIERRAFAYPDFLDLRDQTRSLEVVVATDASARTWSSPEGSERVPIELASPGYLELLGAQPVLGRGLAPGRDEAGDRSPGGGIGADEARQVVISYGFWQDRLGGAEDVLGRTLTLDGVPHLVVGVAPPGFRGLSDRARMWVSFSELSTDYLYDRGSRWHSVLGRLAPRVEAAGAQQEVSTIFHRLAEAHPDTNARYGGLVVPLTEATFGDLQRPLWVLLAAVGFVLLIACANVANLLLVRAAGRRRETALRAALGAGKSHLLRQGLAEAVVLSLVGGALGVLLAIWGVEILTALSPVELPSFVDLGVDGRVLGFALALALGTGILLGWLTTLRASAAAPSEVLREESGRASLRRSPLRSVLLVAEVALALVLAVGAGLMLESWRHLMHVDPGFRAEGVAIFRASLPDPALPSSAAFGPELDAEAREAARRDAIDRHHDVLRGRILETLERLPGVESAALATGAPFDGYNAMVVSREGDPLDESSPYRGAFRIYRHEVSPGYFETLGIRRLRGRTFTAADYRDAPAVAVLSRFAAERLWPDRDPIGQRFKLGVPLDPREAGAADDAANDAANVEWVTVVGVVENVAQRGLAPDPERSPIDPDIYFSMAQLPGGTVTGLVRTAGSPEALLPAIRREVGALDHGMPVYLPETLSERLAAETAQMRFSTSLLGLFAVLALVLAAVGIYGVVAYQVVERVQEIGIRMALGAQRGEVVRQVVGGSMLGVGAGVALGLILSLGLTRLMEGLLFEVSARDPGTLLGVAGALLAVALLASLLPAHRASRVDPAVALRGE